MGEVRGGERAGVQTLSHLGVQTRSHLCSHRLRATLEKERMWET